MIFTFSFFPAAPQSSFFFEPLWHFVDTQHNPSLEVTSEISPRNLRQILLLISFLNKLICFRRSVPCCSTFFSATSTIPMFAAFSDQTSEPILKRKFDAELSKFGYLEELPISESIIFLSRFPALQIVKIWQKKSTEILCRQSTFIFRKPSTLGMRFATYLSLSFPVRRNHALNRSNSNLK